MIRTALSFAVASILSASIVLAGCGAHPGDDLAGQGDGALNGDPCDPSDTACAPAPCDPSDKACAPAANDGVCDGTDPTDPDCEGPCDPSNTACNKGGGDTVDCANLAQTLGELLAQAQGCNIAGEGAKAQCSTFVPTPFGCDAPVADGDAYVTKKYLTIWAEYAASCPLPVPACPDPSTLKAGCVQGPDVDGLAGACAILTDGTAPADAAK